MKFAQAPFFFLCPAADVQWQFYANTEKLPASGIGARPAGLAALLELMNASPTPIHVLFFVSLPISKLSSAGMFTVVCGLVHGPMQRSQLEAQQLFIGPLRFKEQPNPSPKANVYICLNSYLKILLKMQQSSFKKKKYITQIFFLLAHLF